MTKEKFNKKLRELFGNSFQFSPDLGKWERAKDGVIERVNISYNDYGSSFIVKGLSAGIVFTFLEKAIKEQYEQVGSVESYLPDTLQKSLVSVEGINYKIFETEIHDDASFEKVAEELKKLFSKAALPFFGQFSTLEAVAEFLSGKKAEEIVPYIQGPVLFPKTILILREAGHPAFEKKRDEFYAILKPYAEKKDSYKPHLKVFETLFF